MIYGINYGKYNQTILLLCIIGLTAFLISQIIFLLFRERYREYKPANVAINIQPNPASDKTHTSEPLCNEAQFAANNKAIPIIKKRAKITRLITRSFSVFIAEHTESSFLSLIASFASSQLNYYSAQIEAHARAIVKLNKVLDKLDRLLSQRKLGEYQRNEGR